jgi:hypothetical protein
MSFSGDLQDDLHNVFFADFQNTATIGNTQVTGYLSVNNHQFLDLDTNQHIFSGPLAKFPAIKRGQTLVIGGKNYTFITAKPQGSQQNWVIEPS